MALLNKKPPRWDGGWASTRWSLVGALDAKAVPEAERCWNDLVDQYRAPMESYVRRVLARLQHRPCATEEAAEVVQGFLVSCVERRWLSAADPSKGRFRAFLQTLLRRHVGHLVRADRAKKRSPGPGARVYSWMDHDLADGSEEPMDDADDRVAFDREWVAVALRQARSRLAQRNARYAEVVDDLIRTDGEGSLDLSQRVGTHPAQLPVLRHRARKLFAELFEEELRATVADEVSFVAEWRALSAYLP